MVVAVHGSSIGRWVLQIMQIVERILHVGLQTETAPQFLVRCLCEEVLIPLPVGGVPLVGESPDDRTRQAPFGVIIIGVDRQSPIEACCLKPVEGDVGIVTAPYRVFRSRLEPELIVAVAVLIFAIYKEPVLQGEIELGFLQSKRSQSVLARQHSAVGTTGLHIDRSSRGVLRSRLQTLVPVGVV